MTTESNENREPTLDELVAYLCGSAEIDGEWFGEAKSITVDGKVRGKYWWRSHLRKLIEQERLQSQIEILNAIPVRDEENEWDAVDIVDEIQQYTFTKRADLEKKLKTLKGEQ